ncbi:hypothetical protein HanRHA438_Chr06g0273191 [Helianthus annuus]|nr:hypothetical protein HanRHA438_Chr06g0273191 [Helianthus annuus]
MVILLMMKMAEKMVVVGTTPTAGRLETWTGGPCLDPVVPFGPTSSSDSGTRFSRFRFGCSGKPRFRSRSSRFRSRSSQRDDTGFIFGFGQALVNSFMFGSNSGFWFESTRSNRVNSVRVLGQTRSTVASVRVRHGQIQFGAVGSTWSNRVDSVKPSQLNELTRSTQSTPDTRRCMHASKSSPGNDIVKS